MKTTSRLMFAAPAVVGALTLMSAAPAQAQDNRARDALIGAAVGGVAGALLGNGDGTYIAGGALAGAAVGAAASSNRDDCGYRRGGQCYRNQGHWEREHGIDRNGYNSNYSYNYDRRDHRAERREHRRDQRRDYRHERRWDRD